jgi:hypothetical protein
MSRISVDNLQGLTSNVISMDSGQVLYVPGSIIQVQQAFLNTTFSTTTTMASGGVAVTGLSVTITPKRSSSKILLMCVLNVDGTSTVTQAYAWLARGSTKIGAGSPSGSRIGTGGRFYYQDNNVSGMITMNYLDSPASISSLTYNAYVATQTASGSVVVNRTINDTDNDTDGSRQSSTLIAMEIAG